MHFNTNKWRFYFICSIARLFFIILVNFLFVESINAQQLRDLTYKEIENPFNTIPVFVNNPDDAALIFTSSLTNLRFDSNVGIVADQSNPAAGEYRLIILPFRQSITVQVPGFKQLRIPIQVTKAKEVIFFTIEPLEDEVEETSPILFSISPLTAEATVFIDGQPIENLQTAVNLSPGSHTINIESIGYKTIVDTLTIDGTRNFFNYELEQLQIQKFVITSNPDGASVEIDGDALPNQTNLDGFRYPGDYFVRVSKPGYKVEQRSITIKEGVTNTFNFNLEEFGGDLVLNLTPKNASVYLNEVLTPLRNGRVKVRPDQYSLRIQANGYETQTIPVVIEDGVETVRTISLEQIVGSLLVNTSPYNAKVVLIDQFGNQYHQEQGSFILNNIPVGTYTIRSTAPNHNDFSSSVTINKNIQSTATVNMISFSEAELAELERQKQLEEDRRNIAAAEEEKKRQKVIKERRQGFFRRSSFGGVYFHYNLFEVDGISFQNNVDESVGFGLGFFKYKNLKTTSLDFIYNRYTLISDPDLPDEIISYNISATYVPTLPVGPFMVGYGVGFDFTQYEDADELAYHYTYDAFLTFQLIFKPSSWNIGFMIDNRKSWDIGLADVYNPWSQLKYSLILSFN